MFFCSRKAGKDGQEVATKRTFRDACRIPIKGPASSHEASPGTRRRSRGTSALALRGGRPRSGRSERFPARSRACCCCRPEATRTGAEVEKGGVQSFFARGESAKSKKTALFVANPLRSTKRVLRSKTRKDKQNGPRVLRRRICTSGRGAPFFPKSRQTKGSETIATSCS